MLLDTFAWIEFFRSTEKGLKVNELIRGNICFTSAVSLAELSEWVEKEKLDRKFIFHVVQNFSTVLDVTQSQFELAGILKVEKRRTTKNFGIVDAIILATAKQYNLPVVTGDKHFDGENVVLL